MALADTQPSFVARGRATWVSLGGGCQVAHQLRRRALRRQSMPLDWVRTPPGAIPHLFGTDFREFLRPENVVLRSGPPAVLVDGRYGIILPHDIDTYERGGHEALARRYKPRVEALRSSFSDQRTVILVRRRISRRDAEKILAAVEERYAAACVRLLVVNDSEMNRELRLDEPPGSRGKLFVATSPFSGSRWSGCDATWDAIFDAALERLDLGQSSPFSAVTRRFAGRLLGPDWDAVEAQLRGHLASGEIDQVPRTFVRALVAAEDHRFWEHQGIDPIASLRALFGLLTRRNLGGGSTIEQQLYRTLSNRRGRSVRRKVKEMAGARIMAASLPKFDLARLYLLVAYYGAGMNGFPDACARLGIQPTSATDEQAAALAARLKFPETRAKCPTRRRKIATRTEHIMKRMEEL